MKLSARARKKMCLLIIAIALLCFIGFVLIPRFHERFSVGLSHEDTQGSKSLAQTDPESIPEYAGEDCVVLNDNKPCFNAWDLANVTGENFSELDSLGRCGPAIALLEKSMMPEGKRDAITEIRPTGWVQEKYEGVIDSDPPYLYNRCHLIAYKLTGQNANPQNLITGTRHMNVTAMLPWEEKVMYYLVSSRNHVLYRVTPLFRGRDLLSRGVEMEAYSVEDHGETLCFHIFVYNVQPGIALDYATGDNRLE